MDVLLLIEAETHIFFSAPLNTHAAYEIPNNRYFFRIFIIIYILQGRVIIYSFHRSFTVL